MPHFITVSEYSTVSLSRLKSEMSFVDTVITIERFLFLDNFERLIQVESGVAFGEIPAKLLERMLVSAKAVHNGERRLEILRAEIEGRTYHDL